jgi:hypothetical protein
LKTCDTVPNIELTKIKQINLLSTPKRIDYECNQGYRVKSGNTTRICSSEGQWLGNDLQCESNNYQFDQDLISFIFIFSILVQTCNEFVPIKNGIVINKISYNKNGTTSTSYYKDIVIFGCENGYKYSGLNRIATCNQFGQWSMENGTECIKESRLNISSLFTIILSIRQIFESLNEPQRFLFQNVKLVFNH